MFLSQSKNKKRKRKQERKKEQQVTRASDFYDGFIFVFSMERKKIRDIIIENGIRSIYLIYLTKRGCFKDE